MAVLQMLFNLLPLSVRLMIGFDNLGMFEVTIAYTTSKAVQTMLNEEA